MGRNSQPGEDRTKAPQAGGDATSIDFVKATPPANAPTKITGRHIEFLGNPGVGKTWLCRRLREILVTRNEDIGFIAFSPMKDYPWIDAQSLKTLRAVAVMIRHPVTCVRLAIIIIRSRQRSKVEATAKGINLLSEIGRVEANKHCFFTDQGVLQAIWSLSVRAQKPVSQNLMTAARPWLPATVVRVKIDPMENSRRLDRRAHGASRLDGASHEERLIEFEKGEAHTAEILKQWEYLAASHRLFEIVNHPDCSPADALADLIDAIGEPARGD